MFHLLLTLPLFSLAQAQVPSVAIVGIHHSEMSTEEQTDAAAAMARAVKKEGYDPITGQNLADTMQGREGVILKEAFLGPGQKLLDDGRDLYQQAAFDEAEPVLLEAIEALTLAVGSANSGGPLWEAHTMLGTIHVMNEEEQDARDAFANAVALNPERAPNAAEFSPSVVTLYADVKKDLVEMASKLHVRADREEVQIFLNGQDVGIAPVIVEDVIPGANHVVARSANGYHAYQPVDMPEYGNEIIMMKLHPPSLGEASASRLARSRQTATLYRSFGEHSNADLVMVLGVSHSKDTLLLQLYSPRADAFSSPIETALTNDPGAAAIGALPDLFKKVKNNGTFYDSQIAALAVPIDVGSNKLLATMLLNPESEEFGVKKSGVPGALIAVLGIVAAGAIGGTVFALTRPQEPVNGGRITILVP